MSIEKIKTRIAALIAKAHGTDNEHEAAAFLAKAEDMLAAYQLSVWDLDDGTDPMGMHEGIHMPGHPQSYKKHLAWCVAKYYGAECVMRNQIVDGRWVMTQVWVGRESARFTAELMYPFIMSQVRKEGALIASRTGQTREQAIRHVANALVIKLGRLEREKDKNNEAKTGARNSLVVINEIKEYMKEAFNDLKEGRSKTIRTGDLAREAAERVSLHQQMSGKGQAKIGSR